LSTVVNNHFEQINDDDVNVTLSENRDNRLEGQVTTDYPCKITTNITSQTLSVLYTKELGLYTGLLIEYAEQIYTK